MTDSSVIPPYLEQLDALSHQIGDTPLFPIRQAWHKAGISLFAKLEWYQLSKSTRARSAYQIIREAAFDGRLSGERRLLDAVSEEMALAYAAIAAQLGLPLTLVIAEDLPQAIRQQLSAMGATLLFSPAAEGINGARDRALSIQSQAPEQYFFADYFHNTASQHAHYLGTAREIYHQSQGQVTHFVAAAGPGGTFSGTSRKLSEINPAIRKVAVIPEHTDAPETPVIGIADETLMINPLETQAWIKRFASTEGMLLSQAAAANLAAAVKVAGALDTGTVITVFPGDARSSLDNMLHGFN